MYLVKTPKIIKSMFPSLRWEIKTDEKELFLTFDDGPIPEVTPWILDLLDEYNAKATFFVVGNNVEKHPDIAGDIIARNHALGNHTYNHLNGWKTDNLPYFLNIKKSAKLVNTTLFRPPYGKLTPKQIEFLQRHYKIIMWDVLSGDFDENISAEKCYNNVVQYSKPGSIIVFHDNIKAMKKVKEVLPRILEYYSNLGYTFSTIPDQTATFKKVQQITA